MKRRQFKQRNSDRKGTTIMEVYFMLLWLFPIGIATIEFGHCFMTIHTINAAARNAARLGVADAANTAEVKAKAVEILGSAINVGAENLEVYVKDASQFDDPDFDPASLTDYGALPDSNLATLPSHSLFVVRIQVPYAEVGILGAWFLKDVNLYGQAVMRKE